MKNWYTEMDLICIPGTTVANMFTGFVVGTVLSIFMSPLADKIGRKKTVILGMFLSLVAQYMIMFFDTLAIRSLGFTLIGFSCFKITVSYMWGAECVPQKNRAYMFSVINVVNCAPILVFGVYSLAISRDWFPIYIAFVILNSVAFLLCFLLPESPRWLLYSGREKEAIQ